MYGTVKSRSLSRSGLMPIEITSHSFLVALPTKSATLGYATTEDGTPRRKAISFVTSTAGPRNSPVAGSLGLVALLARRARRNLPVGASAALSSAVGPGG